MVGRTRGLGILTLGGLFWAGVAGAAWEFVPAFEIGATTEENPRLDSDETGDDDASATVFDARINMSSFTERGFVQLEPRARANLYSDDADDELEGTDTFLLGAGEYGWENATIGFQTDYRRRGVLRSELPGVDDPAFDDDDFEDTGDVDSGRLVFINQDQERFSIRPYVSFVVSERSTFRFEAESTEVSYTGGNIPGRTGFDDLELTARIVRQANDRNQVSAALIINNFEAAFNRNDSDSVRIEGSLRRNLTDLWNLDLWAGVQRTDFAFLRAGTVFDNADVDFTFGINARRQTERTRFAFGFEKSPEPSASGFIVNREQVRFYVEHDLSQRLSTRIALRSVDTESIGDLAPLNDRRYTRAELSLSWAIRPRWSITGGYNRTNQRFVNQEASSRSSNTIFISLGYQGLSRRIQ